MEKLPRSHSESHVEGLEPLAQVSMNEAIKQRLVQFIRARHLIAGDRLPAENGLARGLHVSRSAVREALRSLEALGVVEARVGSGWYLRDTSLDAVAQALVLDLEIDARTFVGLNQIRVCLECGLLPEALVALQEADFDRLEQTVDEMEELAQVGSGFHELDQRFHQILFAPLQNPAFDRLMVFIWKTYLSNLQTWSPGRDPMASALEHRSIVAALRAGDADLALERLKASFKGLEQLIEDIDTVEPAP